MFSAKPIIASVDLGSDTAKCIADGKAGWVVEPEEVNAIASAMKEAIETPSEQLVQIGINGYNFAINNLGREINLRKLVSACEDVINK